LSQPIEHYSPERVIELLHEAARRANWDAQHDPRHLRTGRFFISAVEAAHAFIEKDNPSSESTTSATDLKRKNAAELKP
jgi:hypothetical protein